MARRIKPRRTKPARRKTSGKPTGSNQLAPFTPDRVRGADPRHLRAALDRMERDVRARFERAGVRMTYHGWHYEELRDRRDCRVKGWRPFSIAYPHDNFNRAGWEDLADALDVILDARDALDTANQALRDGNHDRHVEEVGRAARLLALARSLNEKADMAPDIEAHRRGRTGRAGAGSRTAKTRAIRPALTDEELLVVAREAYDLGLLERAQQRGDVTTLHQKLRAKAERAKKHGKYVRVPGFATLAKLLKKPTVLLALVQRSRSQR